MCARGPVIGLEMATSAIYNHEVEAEGAESFTDTQPAGQDGLTCSGEIRTRTLMDDSVTGVQSQRCSVAFSLFILVILTIRLFFSAHS